MLKRAITAHCLLACAVLLLGCEAQRPLPADPGALEADLTARSLALWNAHPTLELEGQGSVESTDKRKLEGRWRLIAARGKVVELTLSSPLFNETVARLTATPETVRIWLKPPGKREARVYEGPRQQLLAALDSDPWTRDFAQAFTGWLDTWLMATAPTPSPLGLSGVRETGDSLVLEVSHELGTAHLQLRRRDGFPLRVATRPTADLSRGCLSVHLTPENPLSPSPSTLLPGELRGEVRSCCTGTTVTSWRLRVRNVRTAVAKLPALAQEASPPRPLAELPQHEWFRRAGPLFTAQRTRLACPASVTSPPEAAR